jgi:precorrin-6B methylase 1
LVVVGTGIKLIAHTTTEALACIRHAERLFYGVTDAATAAWLHRLNAAAETLDDCYAEGKPREQTYRDMTDRILSAVRSGARVCVAFYGHPGVCADTPHQAVSQARREGFSARMLPGISAEDCLIADLGVDPADFGCQSFDATDFLASRRIFDPTSALILWQVGMLGEGSVRTRMSCRPERLQVLTNVLRGHYQARHIVVLYEAAQFPACRPVIRRVSLSRLPRETVLPPTTLFVPPNASRGESARIMRWLSEA